MSVRIICGDALAELRKLPSESLHCCVTSPPYFGLRDYAVGGQIGLEESPDEYVAALVAVLREVRRALRNDGTLWLNIGDSYASGQANGGQSNFSTSGLKRDGRSEESRVRTLTQNAKELLRAQPKQRLQTGCKPKDLIGIPWLLAFALRNDGWWLRSDIIWAKPNPMPESVTDRPTKAHEYLFLLSRSERYYYDADAIREPISISTLERWSGVPEKKRPDGLPTIAFVPGENTCGANHDGRNKRSVWTVATAPYSEAHFATFPPALIEPCILAGCPEGGTVLDPFAGAGTTGLVADRLCRNALLIELNPAYAEMARRRIRGDAPLLTEVA